MLFAFGSTIVFAGCNGGDTGICRTRPQDGFDPDQDLDIHNTIGTAIFDDFTCLERSAHYWQVGYRKWGVGLNGGVIPNNISVTDDGILVMQANGDNYVGPFRSAPGSNVTTDGTRTGSKIVSNWHTGPGRYEVRMKLLPRFGATTAFWTFWFGDIEDLDGVMRRNANLEIDIELGVRNDFTRFQFVSYVYETVQSSIRDYTPVDANGNRYVLNDGQWHTFKWEWRTNPWRIDCYVNDVWVGSIDATIPFGDGRLTLGNWFPQDWAGAPNFETDYTFVDWVRFTPFLNNPFVEIPPSMHHTVTHPHMYRPFPTTFREGGRPIANLISNARFDGRAEAWDRHGTNATIVNGIGIDGSPAMRVMPGSMASQEITGMREGFEVDFNGKVKLPAGARGTIEFDFMPLEHNRLGTHVIELSENTPGFVADEFFDIGALFTAPPGTRRVIINLLCIEGEIIFDDLFMNTLNRINYGPGSNPISI